MVWLVVQMAVTWALVGLVWFVQVVHYPLFSGVGSPGFTGYHRLHATRTGWVVIPLMLVELGVTFRIAIGGVEGVSPLLSAVGLCALGLVWGSTFLLQVPAHAILGRGFDPGAYRRLVLTNWVRVVAWTVRGLVAAWMVVVATG